MQNFKFDIQRFADSEEKSSNRALALLGTIITNLGLKDFFTKGVIEFSEQKENMNPILKFIGTFAGKEGLNAIAHSITIVNAANEIVNDAKNYKANETNIAKNLATITSGIADLAASIEKMTSDKSSWVLSMSAAFLGIVSSVIATTDSINEDEKEKLNTDVITFLKTFSKGISKTVFSKGLVDNLINFPVNQILDNPAVKATVRQEMASNFTKGGGPLDLIFALINGVVNGIDKYNSTFKKYTEDGIPKDMAKRDAFIDAFTAVIHDTAHTYSKGLDDVAYKGALYLVSIFTGKEPTNKNYVEVWTDLLKVFNYTNTGDGEDNYLMTFEDHSMIYAYDGNDRISNVFSNNTIFGGHDKDTIVSRSGEENNNSIPQENSILGGPGNDLIMAYDNNSTFLGGDEDDRIGIYGKKNKIYGEAGRDAILIENGADDNTVNGGLGDDYIFLENAKNAVIEYNVGDGNDIILGYDESDTIRINGSYSTQTSGQDVIIAVGIDTIILGGSSGKNININNKHEVIGEEQEGTTNAFIPMPSFWYPGFKEIRGTNADDKIDNYTENIVIHALSGNDSINNGGDTVTIDASDDDDKIYNSGNDVSIDGGNGNDSIDNKYGSTVTIDMGAGNDTIRNHDNSSNVTIFSGADNDSIFNSGNSILVDSGTGNDNISNTGSNVTINGNEGNDSISTTGYLKFKTSSNHAMYHVYGSKDIEVFGDAGDDYITASGVKNVLIDAGVGNDTIRTSDYYVIGAGDYATAENFTIIGGKGDDYISSGGKNNLFKYNIGDGNDTIVGFSALDTLQVGDGSSIYSATSSGIYGNSGNFIQLGSDSILLKNASVSSSNIFIPKTVSIQATERTDSIENYFDDATIKTQGGNDSIDNNGESVIIETGNDNDKINNSGSNVSITGGTGNNTINNYGDTVNILSDAGDDSINNSGANTSIEVGDGNNDIYNYEKADYVTLKSGKGNDTIYNSGANTSIDSGDGNNDIHNYWRADYVTLKTGKGNDTIYNGGDNVLFVYDGGNDYISGFSTNSTLKIASGTLNPIVTSDGKDLVLSVGKNKITLEGVWSLDNINLVDAKEKNISFKFNVVGTKTADSLSNRKDELTISSGEGNDTINNRGLNVSIDGGKGDDSISNTASKVTIISGAGNDYIYNSGENSTIDGGSSNDTISNRGANVSINTGIGNNSIGNWNNNVTIISGSGNNTVNNDGYNVLFVYEGSNDYISGFRDNSTLKIASGTLNSVVTSDGKDLILSVGKNKITLVSAYYIGNLNIVDTNDNALTTKTKLVGTENADSISNGKSSIPISTGEGNDSISNSGRDVTILGGKGNDYVKNTADKVSIDGSDGNDTISNGGSYNSGSQSTIIGGKGDDSISNTASEVTIISGTGNDTIYNGSSGKNVLFTYGGGNDSINGFRADSTLKIASGTLNPIVTSNGKDLFLSVGKNKITLVSAYYIDKPNIVDTSDNALTTKTKLLGTENADSISNSKSNITISTGEGNDSIYNNNGSNVLFVYSGGNDSIRGFNTTSTLKIASGTFNPTINSNGEDLIFTVGKNKVTLKGACYLKKINIVDTNDNALKTKVKGVGTNGDDYFSNNFNDATIAAGAGNDSISNWNDSVTIDGGAGNDYLFNDGSNVSINGGADNDTIRNQSSNYVTINAGKGNDSITSEGQFVSINAGAGNDSIINYDENVTIISGTGNDTIYNNWSGKNVLFVYEGGNDSIQGFNETSTLQIGNGKDTYSTIRGDNWRDIIVTSTKGSILLIGAETLPSINIKGTNTFNVTNNTYSPVNVDSAVKVINASARTTAVKIYGNALANTISGGTKNDSIFGAAGNDSILGNSGNDKLYGDAGNDIIYGGKGNDSLWGETGNDTLTGNDGNDFFIYEAGKDIITDYTVGQDKIQIASGKISKTSLSGSDVLFTIGKGSLTVKNAKGKTISLLDSAGKAFSTVVGAQSLTNSNKASVTITADMGAVDASSRTKAIKITGNALANTISGGTKNDSIFGAAGSDSITGNAGNDKLYGEAGNDILLGGKGNDTLWGGAGNDTITGNAGNDIFIYETSNDIITDYTAGQDKISLGADITKTTLNDSDVVFTIGKGSLTIQKAKNKTLNLINSKGKEYSTLVSDFFTVTNSIKSPATIESFVKTVDASSRTKVIAITGNALANTISGGTKNDSLFGAAGNDSILGNAGNDKLYGDAGNDILLGSNGNDSLWGGTGNDTLTGGSGNDIFIYEAGKDIITDYTAGQDKIQIASGKISKTSLSGSDVRFTIGKGSLTVKNAKGKTINLLDSAGKASSTVIGAQSLTNSNKANVTIGVDMRVVDASSRTKAISITGNSLANTISGGTKNDSLFGAAGNDSILGNAGNDKLYGDAGNDILLGGKGNDSLWGGKGNDSLWGDAGADTFFYSAGDGKDVIFGFDNKDTLNLDNLAFKTSYKNNAITFTVDGGSITLKNFSASTFHINNDSYKISGAKLVKK